MSGVPWPGGARCAACVSWDVDADTLVLHRRLARGHDLHGGLSWLRYDEVAVPEIVKVLERFTGRRPSGARAPYGALSASSADFFIREGLVYDSSLQNDSDPFLVDAGGGQLIELPIDTAMSDWPHYAHVPDLGYLMQPKAPADAIEAFRAEFDAAYELGGLWITIWHPHVSGRPARRLAWAKLVETMLARGDVWFATLDEIARHVGSCIDAGTYVPRVVSLPFYGAPLPEFAGLARPGARRPPEGEAP